MSWVWAALMPHPPILVPEVGRGRENEARETLNGLGLLAESLRDRKPDVLLVLSPHQPYAPGALFLNSAERAMGTLAPFGAPSVTIGLACPRKLRRAVADRLSALGARIREGGRPDLTRDQGTLVPLYFLRRAWGRDEESLPENLPPTLLASPIGLTPGEAFFLGERLALLDGGLRWGLVASGDLSHRLTPDAPAGYSPEGRVFDAAVLEALRSADAGPLISLSPETLKAAGECGLRSVMTMLGLAGALHGAIRVFSYEGPFGVGYCSALWEPSDEEASNGGTSDRGASDGGAAHGGTSHGGAAHGEAPVGKASKDHPCVRLARETVTRLLEGRPLPGSGTEAAPSELWSGLLMERRACFVSIKARSGALRGCIGTLAPSQRSLDREIITNAVSAATRDPRFPPMTCEELPGVLFSVDVLSDPEPVTDLADLDPREWGVIVSKDGRRGVLLPDLEGVDTVEEQLAIAARKAGIAELRGASVERFRVDRFKERGA